MSGVIAATSNPSVPASRHWGSDFLWATVLNLAQAGGPFFALLILARWHGLVAAGEFAYAQAVTAPVAQLLNLQLKALMLTHSVEELPLALSVVIRLAASGVGLCIASGMAVFLSPLSGLWMLVRLSDSWAEVFQSDAQRSGRMTWAAVSAMARAITLIACIAFSETLFGAAIGYLCASLALLGTVDRCFSASWRIPESRVLTLVLRRGALLGVVLFLQAASSSIPRVVLEKNTDLQTLGMFAALTVLVQTGNLAASAYGQGLLPWLPQASAKKILGWVALPAVAGLVACSLEMVLAADLLDLLGIRETSQARELLTAIGLSQIVVWPSVVIGYCLTSRKLYRELVWVGIALVCSSALASVWLVPHWGALGAVAALSVPALVNLLLGFGLLPRGRTA